MDQHSCFTCRNFVKGDEIALQCQQYGAWPLPSSVPQIPTPLYACLSLQRPSSRRSLLRLSLSFSFPPQATPQRLICEKEVRCPTPVAVPSTHSPALLRFSYAGCSHFFHPSCINPAWTSKDMQGFRCATHACQSCGEPEERDQTHRNLVPCRICTVSYHVECIPMKMKKDDHDLRQRGASSCPLGRSCCWGRWWRILWQCAVTCLGMC